jgi:hypothetical protein
MDIPPPKAEMGHLAKKIWVEREMDNRGYLATNENYQKFRIIVDLIFISSRGICGEDDSRRLRQ